MSYNARDYLTKGFLKKDDLRRLGPQRLLVQTVESQPGKEWDGKPAVNELVLTFSDGQRLGLRTQENLRRILEAWGPDTDGWCGRELEAYYSPDVRNPRGGEAGGIRVRIPDGEAPVATVTVPIDVPEKALF